ncbi:MAG: autotransporter domain-containing protein [Endomicrobium sp.]|nr:autotransporter domain-containing protein [Endomicrobium sp.]
MAGTNNNISTINFSTSSVTFSSNQAKTSGGAIYAERYSSINFTSSTILFAGNTTVNGNGGAIYVENGGKINFYGSTITAIGNTAGSNGGFLYLHGQSSVTFNRNVSLISNTAQSGGVIYTAASSSTIIFSGSSTAINYNTSTSSDGVIHLAGNSIVDFSNTSLSAIGNYSGGNGGFLYLAGKSSMTFNKGVNLSSNTAGNSGGALFVSTTNIIFKGIVIMSGNIAKSGSGGAIYVNKSSFSFGNEARFTNNKAERDGGAIYAASNSTLTFRGNLAEFDYNAATSKGGAIYLNSGAKASFSNSTAAFSGNIAWNSNTESSAFGYGGAVYLAGTGVGNISTINFSTSSVTFSNNQAKTSGGAIYAGSYGSINFTSSTILFAGNAAVNDGGAVYVENGGKINFYGSTITAIGNTAGSNGGFLYLNGQSITFNRKVSLISNTAQNGGAIYAVSGTTLTFNGTSTTFNNNNASSSGGAIFASGSSSITFINAQFSNNTAGVSGGAVYTQNSSLYFITSGSSKTIFQGNKAQDVSNAFYASSGSKIYFFTSSEGSVEMHDGISGSSDNAEIYIQGGGDFNLYGQSPANEADIIVEGGSFNLKNGVDLSAGKFENNSTLNMNDNAQNILTAKSFINNGVLKLDLLPGKSDQIVSESIELGTSASRLEVVANGIENSNFRKRIFKLMKYETRIGTGTFSAMSVSTSSVFVSTVSLKLDIVYDHSDIEDKYVVLMLFGDTMETKFGGLSGLSFNQKEIAKIYDEYSRVVINKINSDLDYVISAVGAEGDIGGVKGQQIALAQSAGYFLANVIRSAAAAVGSGEIYARIGSDAQALGSGGLWLQGKTESLTNGSDENSLNDYSDSSLGAFFGYDMFFESSDIIFGLYWQANKHNISQDPGNSADVMNLGGGLYAGLIKESWEIKALFSGAFDRYETVRHIAFLERKADSEFSGLTLNADIEGAYKVLLSGDLKLKYYAGMEMRKSKYGEIKEMGAGAVNLIVSENSYGRAAARLGLGFYKDGRIFSWHAAGEYKHLFDGDFPEIESIFEGTQKYTGTNKKFLTRGSQEGKSAAGIKAGAALIIADGFKIYANAGCYIAKQYQNIYGNFGISLDLFSSDSKRREEKKRLMDEVKAQKEAAKKARREKMETEKIKEEIEEELRKHSDKEAKDDPIEKTAGRREEKRRFKNEVKAQKEAAKKARREKIEAEKIEKEIKEELRRQDEEKAKDEAIEKAVWRKEAEEEEKRLRDEIKALEEASKKARIERIEAEKIEKEIKEELRRQDEKKAKDEAKRLKDETKAREKAEKEAEKQRGKEEKERVKKEKRLLKDESEKDKTGIEAKTEEKEKINALILEYESALSVKKNIEELEAKTDDEILKKRQNQEQPDEIELGEGNNNKDVGSDAILRPVLKSMKVKFMYEKSFLTGYWAGEIRKFSQDVKDLDYNKITIRGFTDSMERESKKLSTLRASEIRDELMRNGIPENKIDYAGFAGASPIDTNETEAGRMNNRRAEIIVE